MPRSDARAIALALTDVERDARDALMQRLRERGWTQQRIADTFGVSKYCVVRALLRARVVEDQNISSS